MNDKFLTFTDKRINDFIEDYKEITRQVFSNKKKLFHPGEFGIYREKIVASFLTHYLPSNLSIGSGFIITEKNNISTQCDLIIYDNSTRTIIENAQTFFPVESVVGVIEVKSKLSKRDLIKALQKLSSIKKLKEDITSSSYRFYNFDKKPKKFNSKENIFDSLKTFLICEHIDDFTDFLVDYKKGKVYGSIDKSLFHNMILSIDEGMLLYLDNYKKVFPYSFRYYTDKCFELNYQLPISYNHIKGFLIYFHQLMSSTSILFFEMLNYLQ